MNDCYLTFKTAGHTKSHMTVSSNVHICGHIGDGVSISNHPEGKWAAGYVIAFEDLEKWYLAAKAFRDRQSGSTSTGNAT